jgi:hypothetical protein
MRVLAPLLLAAALSPATAAVVNFDTFSPRYDFSMTTIVTDGFSFTSTCQCMGVEDRPPETLPPQSDPLPGAYNGTASLIYNTDPLKIMTVGGDAFFIDQLDLGLSYYVPDSEVGSIATLTYTLAGGGTGSMDVALFRSYSTVEIGQRVLDISISGGRTFGYVSLDNLIVNNVPEPASAGLALLALLGAGAATQRRRAPSRGTAP